MKILNVHKHINLATALNTSFTEAVDEESAKLNKGLADWRHSEQYKEKMKADSAALLAKITAQYNDTMHRIIDAFLDDFSVEVPDDGKDHSMDIQNALRVIDMLGYDLDADNLNNILAPISGSYQSLKTVLDVVVTKHRNAVAPNNSNGSIGYVADVMRIIDDRLGVYEIGSDYLHMMDTIRGAKECKGYTVDGNNYSDSSAVHIRGVVPYDYLALPDWMEKAAKAYAEMQGRFAAQSNGHVQTDKERIEAIVTGGATE